MEKQTPATAQDTIRVTVPFISGEAKPQELNGDLVFDPTDPYAVQLVVGQGDGPVVTWSFARDLLAEGLYDPIGDGDVIVWPCLATDGKAVVVIELRSPHGMAMLQTPSRTVQRFVETIYESVPAGAESARIDVDAMLAHLLAG
ncbi:MAG: SsgA family sporulation/cell division regulator [Marmoricola sp.]|nr:SsgA family sporulation/cell division regulator [Marmoricola sp.]